MSIQVARTVADLRKAVAAWKHDGLLVGVVPTMGALHAGHIRLVEEARRNADRVVVTIFVNPTQFNNPEDLEKYPRTEADDLTKLHDAGADLAFIPSVDEMYPNGFATTVSVAGVSEGLCGAFRPGHFDGVATVVTKLLLQTGADKAFFGEKDFQQLAVIRRLVTDLDIPIGIVGVPTVREPDGLALSSRNVRLTANGRRAAPALTAALFAAAEAIGKGAEISKSLAQARSSILAAGFTDIEYLELRDAASLSAEIAPNRPSRLLAAAWLDGVRLIDNVAVEVS